MFDPKCYELAESFLGEDVPATERLKNELAQHIQDAAEDWLAAERDRLAQSTAQH